MPLLENATEPWRPACSAPPHWRWGAERRRPCGGHLLWGGGLGRIRAFAAPSWFLCHARRARHARCRDAQHCCHRCCWSQRWRTLHARTPRGAAPRRDTVRLHRKFTTALLHPRRRPSAAGGWLRVRCSPHGRKAHFRASRMRAPHWRRWRDSPPSPLRSSPRLCASEAGRPPVCALATQCASSQDSSSKAPHSKSCTP